MGALIAFVTLLAMLLVAQVRVRVIQWRMEYPMLSLEDPVRSIFLDAEEDRRVVQSELIPRWLRTSGQCSTCGAPALAQRWRDFLEEFRRYLKAGYRRNLDKPWLHQMKPAAEISLAGWRAPEDIAKVSALSQAALPEYLRARAEEIVHGDLQLERARAHRAGRNYLLSLGLEFAFVLFALGTTLAWRFGLVFRARAGPPLAAPTLGRGLLLFVWAHGFVSVIWQLGWEYPDSVLDVFHALPSLALALGISVLLLGTRARSRDTPLKDLLRCPADRRTRRLFWLAGFGSVGAIYAFDRLASSLLFKLGVVPLWTDSIREAILYGAPSQALLAEFNAVVIGPFAEELTYRGVLFGSLATRMSSHRAALISCVVFALMHGYGLYGFVSIAFCGYLWARLAARFGSLLPGMLGHSAVNLLIGVFRFAARG